jgi:hypothetical protein
LPDSSNLRTVPASLLSVASAATTTCGSRSGSTTSRSRSGTASTTSRPGAASTTCGSASATRAAHRRCDSRRDEPKHERDGSWSKMIATDLIQATHEDSPLPLVAWPPEHSLASKYSRLARRNPEKIAIVMELRTQAVEVIFLFASSREFTRV